MRWIYVFGPEEIIQRSVVETNSVLYVDRYVL